MKKTRKQLASVLTAAILLNSVVTVSPIMTSAALPYGLSCNTAELMVGDDGTVNFYCYNAYAKGDECEIALIDENVEADVAIDENGNIPDFDFVASYMYDDGSPENADRTANDGTYSCQISIDTSRPGVWRYHAKNLSENSWKTTETIIIRVLDQFTEQDEAIMRDVNQQLDDFCKKCYAEGTSGEDYYYAMIDFLQELKNNGLIESYVERGYFYDVDGIKFYYHTGKIGYTPPEIYCVLPTDAPPEPTETTEPLPTESKETNQLQDGMVYFSGIYQYMKNDTGITITACDRDITGKLEVPEQIDGYTVTAIGEHAFYLCATVTDITLPETVQSIGKQAFMYCYALESVNLPDGIPEIASETFLMCKALKTVTIPESVTSIGMEAFTECASLNDIKIPDSVQSLGEEVFQKCVALEEINIPDGIKEIPDNAFLGCTSLKNIQLPASTARIGKLAFMLCDLDFIVIRNINCDIDETFATTTGNRETQIHGFANSTAELFAEQHGYPFVPLDEILPTESVEPSEDPSENPEETTEPITIGEILYGDATQDNTLDIADVVLMNRCCVGVESLAKEQIKASDVDGDGKVTLADSMNVLRKLVHLIDTFPVEEVVQDSPEDPVETVETVQTIPLPIEVPVTMPTAPPIEY